MKNLLIGAVALVIIAGGALVLTGSKNNPTDLPVEQETTTTGETGTSTATKSVVAAGTYTVVPAESKFNWSAKKPLIEGYVNSGTVDLKDGSITATENSAQGQFTIDMNTLHVGLTAKKPGKEGELEKHLKTDDFFDVAKFPTATFKITKVEPTANSATTFEYTVTGDLTMKGKTNQITFPAKIYLQDGALHAEAQTEIDRTKWGITYGSGDFFKNLGDKLIANEVALSFSIVAKKAE